ncbi:hypothetical protein [Bacillus piscicola]|uniref:hypothetical protein n=1 Tax=Bacillus piscicola TaxID=1632684 RepID=UPI001F08E589|nr:hypothetical protein [Bacillus piscicola]
MKTIGFYYVAPKSQIGFGFMVVTDVQTGAKATVIGPNWLDYFVNSGLVSASATMGAVDVPAELLDELGVTFPEVAAVC